MTRSSMCINVGWPLQSSHDQHELQDRHPLVSVHHSRNELLWPSHKAQHQDFPGVQWLRIHLPMQETQVRSLVREDPACHVAAEPVCHNS